MSVEIALAIAGLFVTIVLAALSVARGFGHMSAKLDSHGTLLEQHRRESREANDALREDVSELRRDATEIRERVASLETTHKLKALR